MPRDRSDDTSEPAIDEPVGDETVVAGPRAKKKAKFLPSDSGIKTAIYQPEAHGERPATVPEGTDEIALEQPDATDTAVQTGMTLDPSQRARVLDVHDKAAKLLAELDVTSNIKNPDRRIRRSPVPKDPPPEPTVDATAATEPIIEKDEGESPFDDDEYDADDSLDEGETVVDPRAVGRPAYPTPPPSMPQHTPPPTPARTPPPGAIQHTPAPGAVQHTPAPGVQHTPAPGVVHHTPAPGVMDHPMAADETDDAIGIETIETGWSPRPPPPETGPPVDPMAPRPMAGPPPRRTVGSVLMAPFRAIASLFKAPQPQPPPSQQQQLPGIGEVGALQTYTEVNRMVQRRRKAATSAPPPAGTPPGDDSNQG